MGDPYRHLHVPECNFPSVGPGTGRGCVCAVVNKNVLADLEAKAAALDRIREKAEACRDKMKSRGATNRWDSLNTVMSFVDTASMATLGEYL